MKYLAESVEPVSPKEIEKIDAESLELIDLPKFNVPKMGCAVVVDPPYDPSFGCISRAAFSFEVKI